MKATPRWVRRGKHYAPRYVPEAEVKHTISGNGLDGSVRLSLTLEATGDNEAENQRMVIVMSAAEIAQLVSMSERVKQ